MKKYTTLSEELNQLSQERKEIIAARTSEIRLEEITLQHLGEKLGLSQSELVASLELSQREISDLESGQTGSSFGVLTSLKVIASLCC